MLSANKIISAKHKWRLCLYLHQHRDAVHAMLDANVSGAPVVNAAGKIVGVLTEADVIWKVGTPLWGPAVILFKPAAAWCGRQIWQSRSGCDGISVLA
jgi:hypothetical protein